MALKPFRQPWQDNGTYFMNAVAERGGIVCENGTASGVPLEQAVHSCGYIAVPSGEAALGILATDVVNQDLSQRERNYAKKEVQVGEQVTIYEDCEVTTNFVLPGHTPAVGGVAFLAHSGYLATNDVIGGNIRVGRFVSSKDENGYVTVRVKLPQV
jgi:hypothetical protein